MNPYEPHRVPTYRLLIIVTASASIAVTANLAAAATIFESGTLGPTGLEWQDILDQNVLGENVKPNAFTGVRFQLNQPSITSKVGGHFAGPSPNTTIFGAIIRLDNENDFPDSVDLSTSDVLGTALLTFTELSDELFGDLTVSLDPGWYALIFGSGLFGATGNGAALLNNTDIGSPNYIGFMSGIGWGHRLSNKRFVIDGIAVPEPPGYTVASIVLLLLLLCKTSFRR